MHVYALRNRNTLVNPEDEDSEPPKQMASQIGSVVTLLAAKNRYWYTNEFRLVDHSLPLSYMSVIVLTVPRFRSPVSRLKVPVLVRDYSFWSSVQS